MGAPKSLVEMQMMNDLARREQEAMEARDTERAEMAKKIEQLETTIDRFARAADGRSDRGSSSLRARRATHDLTADWLRRRVVQDVASGSVAASKGVGESVGGAGRRPHRDEKALCVPGPSGGYPKTSVWTMSWHL